MSGLALTLVLISALMHSSWNLSLKKSQHPEIFTWCMSATGSIIMFPVGALFLVVQPIQGPGFWFLLVTILLHAAYFTTLSRAYSTDDLSLVYPMSRGFGSALVPIIGIWILGETVSIPAVVGIGLVIVGICVIHIPHISGKPLLSPFKLLRSRGSQYALLTGVIIAAYSTWDKVGVTYVHPLLYMYSIILGVTVTLAPYQIRTYGIRAIMEEWNHHSISITVGALLAFGAYSLVLIALKASQVSYIAPAREVGLVFGILLGVLVLKETLDRKQAIGSAIIVSGLILLSTFP